MQQIEFSLLGISHLSKLDYSLYCTFQCFDAVGWAAGRASGVLKTEWWDAGMVMCMGQGADLIAYGPDDATATHYLLLQ